MSSLTWSVSYQKDRGFRLHLNETPTWVEAVSPIADKVACFFACWLPFVWGYTLGSKILFFLEDKSKYLGWVAIDKEKAFELQPGYWEFFFDEDEDV